MSLTAPVHTTIILVNWNGCADTLACLGSLLKLSEADFNIVVCDNGSFDGFVAAVKAWADRTLTDGRRAVVISGKDTAQAALTDFLTIVDVGANLGFAAANNIGIRLALKQSSLETVWVLNNDTEVEPNALAEMRKRSAEDANIGICGSTLVYYHDRTMVQSVGVHCHVSQGYGQHLGEGTSLATLPDRAQVEKAITYISGASMLVTRRFLETVGLMCEDYFLYGEELDWCLRNNGRFALAWAPTSIVYHKEGASIGTSTLSRSSNLSIYYKNINNLRVIAKFKSCFLPMVLLRIIARASRYIIQGDFSAARVVMLALSDFMTKKKQMGSEWLSTRKPADRIHFKSDMR
jgi:GT2 family glycosyltransferase